MMKVNNLAHIMNTCKPACCDTFKGIPVVDLSDPNAKTQIARACLEVGFFKIVNHDISLNFLSRLEEESMGFFELPRLQKENLGPPIPLGYGNKNIGSNGDVGWIEYLLFRTNSKLTPSNTTVPGIKGVLWDHMNEYVHAVRNMTCGVLEMIADVLNIESSDKLSEMVRDENSDSYFRINCYPICPENESSSSIGFGEHTDPQIISVIRSNNTSGLQISLGDGTWVSITPDDSTFFFIVGDALQVMTNGRIKSVKHRVFTDREKSRLSMIFFAAPTMDEEIEPLVMKHGEKSLYKKFTWGEYKNSAYKSKLGDNRLALYEKFADDIQ